ncbi:unnamed protein product [Clonostachys byssicola]|uniref:2EXR domain-containing protein n=1 Tax=Clonostachys byssicola TaxID=160290 RepID=A0A9N9Y7T3_9HYPO|nr:unnamed protein product [Clonostachys byssicola]
MSAGLATEPAVEPKRVVIQRMIESYILTPASSSSTEFHHFQELPAELRCQIWAHALPPIDPKPVGRRYTKGLWRKKHLTAADEAYNPDGPNECVVFDYKRLKRHHVEVEFADVNREARQITLRWALKHGLEISHASGRGKVFVKSFDPETDVLYVDNDLWRNFFEGLTFEFEYGASHIFEPMIPLFPYITQLFVGDSLFLQVIVEILTVLEHLHTLTAFYLLLSRPRAFPRGMAYMLGLQDLIPIKGTTRFTWHLEHEEFRLHGSPEPGREAQMFAFLWSVGNKLKAKFIEDRKQKFEMATTKPYGVIPFPDDMK